LLVVKHGLRCSHRLPFPFPSTGRQLRLTFSRFDSPLRAGALPVPSGRSGPIRAAGPFLEAILPPWPKFIVPDIPSGLSFIGCYFITSTVSWRSTRDVLRRSMASSARSSRKSSSATWTAATRAAGSPAFVVRTAMRNAS